MTIQIANNLVRTRKKDLTNFALALIMARATPYKIVVVLLLAPPRQNFRKVKHFFKIFLAVVFHVEHPKVGTFFATLRGERPKNHDPLFVLLREFLLSCQIFQSIVEDFQERQNALAFLVVVYDVPIAINHALF